MIVNWEKTINSRLGYVTAEPFTVCPACSSGTKLWLVCLGRILFQARGWKPGADTAMSIGPVSNDAARGNNVVK